MRKNNKKPQTQKLLNNFSTSGFVETIVIISNISSKVLLIFENKIMTRNNITIFFIL